MTNRQLFGDLSLAVLLALPLLALARPPVHHNSAAAPAAIKVATTDHLPGNGRISLL